ncbi:MAG: 3-dehydroquinate synthase [Planctomycetes bacterium]|nr:3-dehydroquinate synthase [Planctomycetota bacterium]
MAEVRVELGERSYTVYVERGAVGRVARHIPRGLKPTRVWVISDENVAPLYAERVVASFEDAGYETALEVIPAGEREKNLSRVERLYHRMIEARLDRKSLVAALGGGVVGDIAGFAAATYMRGLAYVQVPTTIVAQVDSSVGGKTGVDLAEGKNLVGAFHQPAAVVIDPETLSTLPVREVCAGLAEVVKHGAILDAGYFARLEELGEALLSMDAQTAEGIVVRSVEIKADVVSRDEREGGMRAILNFGHTVGHALEAATGYEKYLHGEAVAVGMAAAANIAEVMGLADEGVGRRIRALLGVLGLPVTGEGHSSREIAAALGRDKKAVGGTGRFVLVSKIGRAQIGVEVPMEALIEGLSKTGFPR